MDSISRQQLLMGRATAQAFVEGSLRPGGGPGQAVLGIRTDAKGRCRGLVWVVVMGWLLTGCGSGDLTGKGVVEDTRVGDQVSGVMEPGADQGTEWKFAVGGMHCEGCAGGVQSEILRVPGVHWGRVDFASGLAEVRVDVERVTTEALERVVVEAGYTVQWREP